MFYAESEIHMCVLPTANKDNHGLQVNRATPSADLKRYWRSCSTTSTECVAKQKRNKKISRNGTREAEKGSFSLIFGSPTS